MNYKGNEEAVKARSTAPVQKWPFQIFVRGEFGSRCHELAAVIHLPVSLLSELELSILKSSKLAERRETCVRARCKLRLWDQREFWQKPVCWFSLPELICKLFKGEFVLTLWWSGLQYQYCWRALKLVKLSLLLSTLKSVAVTKCSPITEGACANLMGQQN